MLLSQPVTAPGCNPMVWGHPVTTDTPSVSLHSCPSQTFPGPHSAHKCFSPSSLVPRRVFLSPPSLAPQKSCPGRSHHFEPAGGSNGMRGGSGGPRSLASHRDLGVPTYPLDGDSCRALQQPLSQPQPEASARSQGCHRWKGSAEGGRWVTAQYCKWGQCSGKESGAKINLNHRHPGGLWGRL